jgi:hypothetical protein
MDEYGIGTQQYAVRSPTPASSNPQINEQTLTSSWQPHAHLHNHQPQQNNNQQAHGFDVSRLNLQKQALPHRPSVSFTHDQVDHMKREASRIIIDERRQLDEAEQILAMPGFLKAFDIFLRASQKK